MWPTLPATTPLGVALYHAWWGLNDDVKAFADRLADAGFFVVAPDLYRGSITAEIEEAKQLTRSVDEADADAIALAAIDRLANRPNAPSRIGAVGFSFGAHWAMWSAAQRDAVGASVVYYGTTGGPFLAEARIPVQGHFAADDPFEGPDDVAAFEGALRDAGPRSHDPYLPGHGALVRRTVARCLPARGGRTGPRTNRRVPAEQLRSV